MRWGWRESNPRRPSHWTPQSCITNNSAEPFFNYIKHDGVFIHSFNVDDKNIIIHLKKKHETNLDTESPVYHQILLQ